MTLSPFMYSKMLSVWDEQGDPLTFALLDGTPDKTDGEWPTDLSDWEIAPTGYTRGTLALSAISDAVSQRRRNLFRIAFGENSDESEVQVTHVAVIGDGDAVLSIVRLARPVVVGGGSAFIVRASDLGFDLS